MTDSWQAQREALGAFIRTQRQMANLSLRQLADLTSLSNPYLSQVERGLHEPSVRVLKAISDALNVSAETLLAQAGLVDAVTGEKARRPPGRGRRRRADRGRDRGRQAAERRSEGGAHRRVPEHGRPVMTGCPARPGRLARPERPAGQPAGPGCRR